MYTKTDKNTYKSRMIVENCDHFFAKNIDIYDRKWYKYIEKRSDLYVDKSNRFF